MSEEERKEYMRLKTRAWVAANPERKRQADAEYRAKNKDKIRESQRKWYQENKDKAAEKSRADYQANKDAYKERARKSLDRNREQVYVRIRARAVKKRETIKSTLLKAQNGRCAYCRSKLIDGKYHIDHIIPVRLGGGNDISNYQLACVPCNITKRAQDPIVFAQSLGRLI